VDLRKIETKKGHGQKAMPFLAPNQ